MRRLLEIRFLGLVCVFAGASVTGSTAFAQLRGEKNASVLNYLGRFHGVGYSDGYHTCPDKARCGNGNLGNGNLGLGSSQLYSAPSTVEHSAMRPSLGVQDRWLGLRPTQQQSQAFVYENPSYPSYSQYSTPAPVQGYAYPQEYMTPTPAPLPAPAPSVPAVPVPGPYSPSDTNPRMLNPNGLPNGVPELPVSRLHSGSFGQSPSYPQSELSPQFVSPTLQMGPPAGQQSMQQSILLQSYRTPAMY